MSDPVELCVLQVKKTYPRPLGLPVRSSPPSPSIRSWRCRNSDHNTGLESSKPRLQTIYLNSAPALDLLPDLDLDPARQEIDPLYLFACHIAWDRREEASAGWELISAANSANSDTRAHARALLCNSRHLGGAGLGPSQDSNPRKASQIPAKENNVKKPCDLELVENCAECTNQSSGSFCEFAPDMLRALDEVSHKMTLPAGAILFVEGQTPRGIFIVCSGRVNLSTTSRDGKILILKSAEVGQVLGLSATVSHTRYETTAEAATPCQVTFIDRKHFMKFMVEHSEVGLHTAQCLSRDYQSAYRDIHDLILTRTSAGKLAKLLLSQSGKPEEKDDTTPTLQMTHEEMAQRIGASRETVTRLLTTLRRKRLIRLDGPKLVIRNRTALEALTV